MKSLRMAVPSHRQSPFFSPENLNRLSGIMYPFTATKGSYLFMEDDTANKLFYIHKGCVKIAKTTDDGKEIILYFLQEGDLFGDISGDHDSTYGFYAEVLEDSEVGIILQSDLEVLLYQHGDLAIEFVKWMGLMHKKTQSKFRDLMLYGKPGALCSTLIRLTNSYGKPMEDGILITLKLTNTELANMIGTTRESVNRILADLKAVGAIRMDHGHIVVTDLVYLKTTCKCAECPVEICRI